MKLSARTRAGKMSFSRSQTGLPLLSCTTRMRRFRRRRGDPAPMHVLIRQVWIPPAGVRFDSVGLSRFPLIIVQARNTDTGVDECRAFQSQGQQHPRSDLRLEQAAVHSGRQDPRETVHLDPRLSLLCIQGRRHSCQRYEHKGERDPRRGPRSSLESESSHGGMSSLG